MLILVYMTFKLTDMVNYQQANIESQLIENFYPENSTFASSNGLDFAFRLRAPQNATGTLDGAIKVY